MTQTYVDKHTERTLNKLGLDWFINKGNLYAYVMEEICILKIYFTEETLVATKHYEDLSSEDKKELEGLVDHLIKNNSITKVYNIELQY